MDFWGQHGNLSFWDGRNYEILVKIDFDDVAKDMVGIGFWNE